MSQYTHRSSSSLSSTGQQLKPFLSLPFQPYDQDSLTTNTLPPLHTQYRNAAYQQPLHRHAASEPQTPLTPHTPATPRPNGSSNFLPQIATQPSIAGHQLHSPFPSILPTHSSPLSTTNGSCLPSVTTTNMQLENFTQMPLQQLSPVCFGGPLARANTLPSFGTQPLALSQLQDAPSPEARPMPVVGSQGRRGVLPSATGRPSALGIGVVGSATTGVAPTKDNEGKFPCVYCNKTYLHLKHLKRHLLRHTGERPYQCCLCQETFCRSDILKRHFTKCSLRRGNPTGATHLTHAQAHLRPTQSAPNSAGGLQTNDNITSISHPPSSFRGNWHNSSPHFSSFNQDQPPQMSNGLIHESNHSSRSSSILKHESSSDEDRKRFSGTSGILSISDGIEPGGTSNLAVNSLSSIDRTSGAFHYNHDRLSSQGYQDPQASAYYCTTSGLPHLSLGSQVEQPQPFFYSRGGFQQYHGTQSVPQAQSADWSTYFQPGAQGNVMFSGSAI